VQGSRTIACTDTRGTKTYTFDQVLFQSSQEDVYEGTTMAHMAVAILQLLLGRKEVPCGMLSPIHLLP
jgi:hypothetical protein